MLWTEMWRSVIHQIFTEFKPSVHFYHLCIYMYDGATTAIL